MPVAAVRRLAIRKASPAQLAKYFEAKLSAELGPHNVKRLLDAETLDVVVLDVRSREGYNEGHIPGAVNIPFEELPQRLQELSKLREIICYCWDVTCFLSAKAAYVLAKKGYRVKELIGGIAEWKKAGFPINK